MKFEFKEYLEPVTPLVQKKKKYQNFTVTEIGGAEELKKWKDQQAELQAQSLAKREKVKELQKLFIAGPDAPVGDSVTWAGEATVVHGKGWGSSKMSWKDKLEFALSERKRLAKSEIVSDQALEWKKYDPLPVVQLPLFKRMKSWIRGIWDSANF